MVYPNVTATATTPQPSRVEYLATLSKHTAAVNVVRFSPNGMHAHQLKLLLLTMLP
jgi:hypothetical protein